MSVYKWILLIFPITFRTNWYLINVLSWRGLIHKTWRLIRRIRNTFVISYIMYGIKMLFQKLSKFLHHFLLLIFSLFPPFKQHAYKIIEYSKILLTLMYLIYYPISLVKGNFIFSAELKKWLYSFLIFKKFINSKICRVIWKFETFP